MALLASRFLKSKLMNTNFGDLYMPSTGALMLLTALHTCDQVTGAEDKCGWDLSLGLHLYFVGKGFPRCKSKLVSGRGGREWDG